MSAIYLWSVWRFQTTFLVHEPLGFNNTLTHEVPAGWNLQRIIYSGVDQAFPTQLTGDTDYYMQPGVFYTGIGVSRGGTQEAVAFDRYWPAHIELEQASRVADNKLWNGTMSTDAMVGDFDLRRTNDPAPGGALDLFFQYGYSPVGWSSGQSLEPTMEHHAYHVIRFLCSQPR